MSSTKKVAILQSNYIPWKGYFDLISAVDEFIFYDEMQFTKRDWRNRNQIKTPQGLLWLTVPVKVKGKFYQTIRDTEVDGHAWQELHWKTISQNYKKAKYYSEIESIIKPLYLDFKYYTISELNQKMIITISNYLNIKTTFKNCGDYNLVPGKTERLANLCVQAGATEYVSGPAAKDYIEEKYFSDVGVQLTWFNYDNYPSYFQLWGEFCHGVSILDLLFNCGPNSYQYMRYVK